MNTPSRKQKIEAMLAEDPNDVFLRYGLAMELQKEGAVEESLERFGELMRMEQPHVPAFFMAAKVLLQAQRTVEARELLRTGMEEARRQADHHAASEMGELLMALGGP